MAGQHCHLSIFNRLHCYFSTISGDAKDAGPNGTSKNGVAFDSSNACGTNNTVISTLSLLDRTINAEVAVSAEANIINGHRPFETVPDL